MPEVRLIDANAFLEQYGNYYAEEGTAEGFIGTVGELIAKQPTIEPEERHGRWTKDGCEHRYFYYRCSICGAAKDGRTKFCPNCGARMDGGSDNG